MNGFKFWIFSLCGATAVTAIFKILLSGSSLNKVLNIFFSLFVLFYTIIPLQELLNEKIPDSDISANGNSYSEFYEEGYKSIIEKSIKNECKKISVQVLSMDIEAYIDEEGYLMVEQLSIETDSPDKSDEIRAHLKKQLGYEVEVS